MKKIQLQNPLYYLPLIFIAFPVFGVFKFNYPLWTIWFTLGFVVSYLYLVHKDDSTLSKIIWIYMLLYILFMTFVFDGGMVWFYFHITNLLSFKYNDKLTSFRMLTFIFIIVITDILVLVYRNDLSAKIMAVLVTIMCCSLMYYWKREAEREKQKEAILEKNNSINILIAENERNRIGQDLHDTLGHVFAMLSVKAELANALLNKDEIDMAKNEIKDLQEISKKSMNDVRQIVESLKEPSIKDEITILNNMLEIAGITFNLSGSEFAYRLPSHVQGKFTMILRELVTNLIKHSSADNCILDFSVQDCNLILDYKDDGIGFSNIDGTELHAIKDRLVTIKGKIDIVSKVSPTHIRIYVPMEDL